MSQTPAAPSARWTRVHFLWAFLAAFCFFYVFFGVVFFLAGGFLLFVFKKYLIFAIIVAVPALVLGGFAASVAASPDGWPSPIGDLGSGPDNQ